jgi:hypothetical protein
MSPVKDPKVELVIVMFIVPLVVNVSNSLNFITVDKILTRINVLKI